MRQNKIVVGASSLMHDVSRDQYPLWAYLPYINDRGFENALAETIQKHGITQIYSANPVVWEVLRVSLPQIAPGVELLGGSPAEEMLAGYRSSKQVADRMWNHRDFLVLDTSAQVRMHKAEFTALVRHAETIPGMCDHQKLLTLSEIFRIAPQGDVVEIGSWWGKSAFILAHLARRYQVGNLLCVDPWSDAFLAQDDKLVDDTSNKFSADEAHQVFVSSILPYSSGNINFIRMPSLEGAEYFRKNRKITTDTFGETNYVGKISVLHIDGNHAQSAVEEDTKAWSGLVAESGWIVFDDYKWAYGDGPKLVADAFIQENAPNILSAFFTGGALFVRLSHRVAVNLGDRSFAGHQVTRTL